MPPKKKGKTISPIVVGTVSTRSTRRQSVVNIEIPKLKEKVRSINRKCLEKREELSSSSSDDLCEKIKATYSKVIGSCERRDFTVSNDDDSKTAVNVSTVSTENKELLQILEDWSDEDSEDKKECSSSSQKQGGFENLEFGAEEINKIISDKHFGKKENISYTSAKEEIETSFEDIKEIEHTLSSEKDESEKPVIEGNISHVSEVSDNIEISQDTKSSEDEVISEISVQTHDNECDQNSCDMTEYVTEEVITVDEHMQLVEETSNLTLSEDSCENVPVPDKESEESNVTFTRQVEEQNYSMKEGKSLTTEIHPDEEMEVIEEVSEEIVSPPGDKMIVLQEDEIKSNTTGSTPYEEVDLANQNNEVRINVVCDDVVMSDTESNLNNQIEVLTVAITNDETIQSLSTTDSNDSEVRNYFAKEIERNETVINVDNEIITHSEDREINSNRSSVIDDNTGESASDSSEVQSKESAIPLTHGHVQTEDITLKSEDIYVPESTNNTWNKNDTNSYEILNEKHGSLQMPMSNSDILCTDISELDAQDNHTSSDCKQTKHKGMLENVQKSEDTLNEKVALLNLEISLASSTKKNQKATVMTSNEIKKVLQKNKKTVPKKCDMDLQLTKSFEKMNVIAGVKPKFKRNQKKGPTILGTVQNIKMNKNRRDSNKLEERLDYMGIKTSETSVTDFPTKTNKITGEQDLKGKKPKKEDAKAKKKTSPILVSKIKFSPTKKKKEALKKIEPEEKKKKENVKRIDQQINKKGVSKKMDQEGKEQIRKNSQDEIKKEKEFTKKFDQENSNKKDIKAVEPDVQMKEILEKSENESKSEAEGEDIEVRRSSRIKSISVLKKKTTGHGLVRSKSEVSLNETDILDSSSIITESEKSTPLGTPSASPKINPRERKTRWSKVETLPSEMTSTTELVANQDMIKMNVDQKPKLAAKDDPVIQARLKQFIHLKENVYKTSRMTCKEAKKMTCDCFLTEEEISANEYGCGEDCLNRLLLIECGNVCQVGDRCTNKRFQKGQFAPLEVFNTEKKGLGLRAAANIPFGEFILEYVGEVLNSDEFDKRAEVYSQDKNIHYYFMALRADAIIDATMKGNISRFINHSCDPNAETQKWTVNGELRIGFFSTRTILAGEEVTFDYRFQRYGKEAQKCYCGASICRGWLGEEPDEESEDEEYEEEEEEVVETAEVSKIAELPALKDVKLEIQLAELPADKISLISAEGEIKDEQPLGMHEEIKPDEKLPPSAETPAISPVKTEKKILKKKVPKKKPRVELFEEIDQLNEEIEMLVATGLKNQSHTLRLSRLMVRAQDPQQRAKILRVLRRGELPCRRLFLDYHGLRLMHGYMTDAQHLVIADKKFESLRLEMLQTLAVLPIPNKTMLQDSKVLSTVEKWATNKDFTSPLDSDSNSPKTDQDVPMIASKKIMKKEEPRKDENVPERSIEDQEEEIRFLATKLLEEWKNLKEVFRIPKKERIEQMKEHEREANKKFMQSGYGQEDKDRKLNEMRYRGSSSKYRYERDNYNRKSSKNIEQYSAEFMKLSKIERRKLFAIQHELKEEEHRLKQRELWRQHEVNCLMIGTDPRFTAPFDPSKPYQLIWNPQLGQWQTYPLPQNSALMTPPPPPLPSTSIALPQIPKSIQNFFTPPLPPTPTLNTSIPQLPSVGMPSTVQPSALSVPHNPHVNALGSYSVMPNVSNTVLPSLTHTQSQLNMPPSNMSQLNVTQLHGTLPPSLQQHTSLPQAVHQHATLTSSMQQHSVLPPNLQHHAQLTPNSIPATNISLTVSKDQKLKEEDPTQVQFLGPIPNPVKLPPKWKCAKDKYGRPYYYHVKIRKSQWIPPPLTDPPIVEEAEFSESESSSDSSSESSGSSSENSDSDDDVDDTKLLMEVRKQVEKSRSAIPQHVRLSLPSTSSPSPEVKFSGESDMETDQDHSLVSVPGDDDAQRPSIDIRLKEQFNLKDDKPPRKKRRIGLCEEIIISPRTEEDKLQFKEDIKKYKANKEKLRRQKELIIQQTRKQLREVEQQRRAKEKRSRTSLKVKIKDKPDFHSEDAKKIKETFRANMASTVVSALNAYRKSDCKEGRITNTEDFKHLARKLTHFVMLKEMKHIARIEDLMCSDNVKVKAREYIRKYMNKFGEVYIKRNDSPDFKD